MSGNSPKLNDSELAQLDDFLLSEACDDETLTVDEVHGLLSALLVGPHAPDESEWLVMSWGEPNFVDEAQQQQMLGLMRRLCRDIEVTLQTGRDFEPLAVEIEENGMIVVAYEGWCYGFMLGVESAQDVWDTLPKDEGNLLAPMAQLALLNSDEEPEMDEDEYEQWVELLPGAVMGLYSYWHQ
ncbi:MAG: YecA family protein [Chromatiales bacterium]|nr:YecA family protein [Chromatiales bacterium]